MRTERSGPCGHQVDTPIEHTRLLEVLLQILPARRVRQVAHVERSAFGMAGGGGGNSVGRLSVGHLEIFLTSCSEDR